MNDDPEARKDPWYLIMFSELIKNKSMCYIPDPLETLKSHKSTEKQEADKLIEKRFLTYLASEQEAIKTNQLNYRYPQKIQEDKHIDKNGKRTQLEYTPEEIIQYKFFRLLSAVLNVEDTTLRLDKEMFRRMKNANYIEHMIDTFNEVTGKKADFDSLYEFIFNNDKGHDSKDILRVLTNTMQYTSADKNITNELSERLKKMTEPKEKIGEYTELSSQIKIAKDNKKYMVNIATEWDLGSGVIYKVTEDYVYILTNHHVVSKKQKDDDSAFETYDDDPINYANTIEVDFLADNVLNKKIKAKILSSGDGKNDIALIRVNKADIQFEAKTELGNESEEAKEGELHYIDKNLRAHYNLEAPYYATEEEFNNCVNSKTAVVAIGNSKGLGPENDETYASGFGKIIGYKDGSFSHDAKLYGGNSGSGAFNKEGKIIGINNSRNIYDKDGVNIGLEKNSEDVPYGKMQGMAVPSFIAAKFAEETILIAEETILINEYEKYLKSIGAICEKSNKGHKYYKLGFAVIRLKHYESDHTNIKFYIPQG